MKQPVITREGAEALGKYLQERITEYRDALEDKRLDDKPLETVSFRARLNELKDILDQFEIPTA